MCVVLSLNAELHVKGGRKEMCKVRFISVFTVTLSGKTASGGIKLPLLSLFVMSENITNTQVLCVKQMLERL